MTVSPLNVAEPTSRVLTLFRIALWIFIGTMVFSLAGSLFLKVFPASMAFFGPYYPILVKAPTWSYMALLPILPALMYGPVLGWRLAFFALWGSAVGAASELVGTTTGFPFGTYAYTDWLGPKILGHVPYFIPLSWFAMSILSLDLARRVVRGRYGRILVATLFMVCWDVALDPAMSRAFPFWVYPGGGFFYGMPLSNWIGWFGVSLVIMSGYEFIGGGLPASNRWAPVIYLLNGLFPLLLSLLYGLYGAFVIGAVALSLPLLAIRLRRREEAPRPEAPEAETAEPLRT